MTATRRSDLPERAGFVFQQYVRIAAARPSIARAVFGLVLRGMDGPFAETGKDTLEGRLHPRSEPAVRRTSDGWRASPYLAFMSGYQAPDHPLKERQVRVFMIAGVALIAAGAFVLLRGGSFTTRHEMLRVGDMSVSAEERRPIEPWLAGVAVVFGIALLATGARRKATPAGAT